MKPKVSVVVPVHNAGKFFSRCLDSLIGQTLTDIEIILVLDTPTDGSDKVAEQYAQQDKRIRIVRNTTNLHIGYSRNAGIDVAEGDYVGFSDDDDVCHPRMFEVLYEKAQTCHADIVVSNYCNEVNGKVENYCFPEQLSEKEFKQKYLEALIRGNHSQPDTVSFNNVNPVWNQIFSRELLNQNNIRFTDNRKVSMEDVIFNIQAHFYARKVEFVPQVFYRHIINEKNAFNNYDYLSHEKVTAHIHFVHRFMEKNGMLSEYRDLYLICIIKRVYTSFRNEIRFKRIFHAIPFIRKIRNNADLQQAISPLFEKKQLLNKLPVTKRLFAFLIRK
ncbi:MAG TPA: glycosyltransferase [Paludibacteraceae bacterium]|nr:glycosyltransferase [Paludibacteraceae bacterium]HPT42665.1 glycosyltransferase [Paludibacteraceae bacterium]